MKKAYTKPEMYFESFQLSANIATCGHYDYGYATSSNENTCGFYYNEQGMVFTDKNSTCVYKSQDGTLSMFCYHTASIDAIFNS